MSSYSRLSMIEAAAVFTGALAYPRNPTKAEELAACMICGAVDQMVASPDRWGEAPESLRLVCRLRNRSAAEALIRDATRIISSQRLPAAKMAFPKIHASICDALGVARPKQVPGPFSSEMVASIGIDLGQPNRQRSARGRKARGGSAEGNKANIERCWKPSLPVLHMAMALERETTMHGISGFSIGDLLVDADLVQRLIQRSSAIAPAVAATFDVQNQVSIVPFAPQIN